MNSAASSRQLRAPGRPAVGFLVAQTAIIVATALLVIALGSHLPGAARDDAVAALRFEFLCAAVVAIAIAARRGERAAFSLESALPLGLAGMALGLAWLVATLWLNLDASAYRPLASSLPGFVLMAGCTLPWLLLGRYLAGLAASDRVRRDAASSRRSAWLAEVGVDRSWRVLFGAALGVPTALVMVWIAVSQPAGLPVELVLAVNWAFATVLGERASVAITEGGVKVRHGYLLQTGWSVPLRDVASVDVVAGRPRLSLTDRRRCLLREGPALAVTTGSGDRYVVSLPDAAGAAEAVNTLRGRRAGGASPLLPV